MPKHTSLRLRIIAPALALLFIFQAAFCVTLFKNYKDNAYQAEYQKLESDVATLLSLSRIKDNVITMPEETPNDAFNEIASDLLGIVLNESKQVIWLSTNLKNNDIQLGGHFDHTTTTLLDTPSFGLLSIKDDKYFYFILSHNLDSSNARYYFLALHKDTQFNKKVSTFWSITLKMELALLMLTLLLAVSIYIGLHPLNRIDEELNEISQGVRDRLSTSHPSELNGITGEFNVLLDRERIQKERYKNTLSNLAHSLKTPIAVLKLLTERPPENGSKAKQDEFIDSCSLQLQQMSSIIQYQLKRAIVTTSKKKGNPSFKPYELLMKLCRNLAKVQENRQISWHLDCQEQTALAMNRQDFFECAGNLLENAFRLCKSTVHIQLKQHQTQQSCQLLFTVEDDGPGVPDDSKERIMQRGIRADRNTPGHGLGLAIIKDITNDYDGSITVRDSQLGGALFILTLPLKPVTQSK